MKKTIVVYGSSTGTCEEIANTIAGKLGVDAINVTDFSEDTIYLRTCDERGKNYI